MRFSELEGRAVAVWGVGVETRSFARQLRRHLPGARVAAVVLDDPSRPVDDGDLLADAPAIVGAGEALDAVCGCAVLVRSPGVSIHRPELRALRAAGVPAATATGLWLAERGGRAVIGVTGTKGKSTTASLIAHLARAARTEVELAGNIGRPALDLLDEPADRLAVIELSSYQVADLVCGPQIAVVINLYKEHVDWHGDEATYRAEKLRLLALPGVERCVVNALDAQVAAAPCAGEAQRTTFGDAGGWHVTAEGAVAHGDGSALVPADALPLRGRHNAMNVCAALAALDAAGLPRPPLPDALAGFAALPHRLQPVAERDGVLWVDDSISTTPESALAALDSYAHRDVVLIGGGLDRGQDYTALGRALAERGAAVLGLPSTGERLVAAAGAAGGPDDRARVTTGMPDAVARAAALARPGAVVLLSPAAPSYDTYKSFQERGDHFAALARTSSRSGFQE